MRSMQPSRGRREVSPFGGNRNLMSRFDDFFNEMEKNFFGERSLQDRGMEQVSEFIPQVDIEESDEMYLVSVDLPGIKKEDIKIDVQGNMLRISGQKSREVKEEGYYERSSGKFQRSLSLPESVDPKKIEANYEDGVLRVVLPKTEVKQAQEIKVQSGQPQGLLDRFLHREKTVKSEEGKEQQSKH